MASANGLVASLSPGECRTAPKTIVLPRIYSNCSSRGAASAALAAEQLVQPAAEVATRQPTTAPVIAAAKAAEQL